MITRVIQFWAGQNQLERPGSRDIIRQCEVHVTVGCSTTLASSVRARVAGALAKASLQQSSQRIVSQ